MLALQEAEGSKPAGPTRSWTVVNLRKGRITVGFHLSEAESQTLVTSMRAGRGSAALLQALTAAYKANNGSGAGHGRVRILRELRLGSDSETVGPSFNKVRKLLEGLEGITFAELSRPDECCGFGGTFAVSEEAVSCMMGLDRIHDHEQAGTEVLTAGDMSCLMHLEGLIRRQGKQIKVMHIAEILVGNE